MVSSVFFSLFFFVPYCCCIVIDLELELGRSIMTLTVSSECWFAFQSLYVTVIYNVGSGKGLKSEVGSRKLEGGSRKTLLGFRST